MRVALVHDYIKEYGGAERVLEALHEIYPDAPVFTSLYIPEFLGPHRERFENWDIRTSIAQFLPFKAKLISPLRIIAPLLFKSFDFSDFDVVIVSATGAYNPNIISKKIAVQICYCHTPPRYLYGFATAREWKNNVIFRVLGELANHFLRLVDFRSAQNVDFFIANSQNVAARVRKFYRKNSTVIYPPVGLSAEVASKNFRVHNAGKISDSDKANGANAHSENFEISPRSYYLTGGRLARPKHIDLIVETCAKLNLSLKVFGRGFAGFEEEIKNKILNIKNTNKKSKIEFLGEIKDNIKLELMRNAKAFIIAAEDEDFGITPVEAMSVGTPVIAYRSGGVLESIIAERTGLFFNELSIDHLSKAIKQFNNLTIRPEDCIFQAQKFSKERFKKEISAFVENKI
ncbi:MAG: glycosyltransferase [Candidatus Levybacteria bacterium]|nr:glycosyltransferase [Candidatus Levybacteria bacterium]